MHKVYGMDCGERSELMALHQYMYIVCNEYTYITRTISHAYTKPTSNATNYLYIFLSRTKSEMPLKTGNNLIKHNSLNFTCTLVKFCVSFALAIIFVVNKFYFLLSSFFFTSLVVVFFFVCSHSKRIFVQMTMTLWKSGHIHTPNGLSFDVKLSFSFIFVAKIARPFIFNFLIIIVKF